MAPTASTSSAAALHLASARRATFNKTRKGANKTLNWPYPLTAAAARTSSIHPDRLVEAGFYCTPTHGDPTVTTCFLCEIVIGQWEEGEDPLYRHQAAIDEAEIQCGWLTVLSESWTKDGVADGIDNVPRETWPELWGGEGAEMHPRGERMAWARLATFRLGWPHEGDDGVPTKEEIAAAGWVFRPGSEEESQDQCACIYCGRTVEGWEEGDDPVALHKRKIGLKCPFFLADNPTPASATTAVAGKEAPAASPEADDGEGDEPEQEAEVVKPKRGSKKEKAMLAEAAPKKSTRGTAAKQGKADVESTPAEDGPAEEADAEAVAVEHEVVEPNDQHEEEHESESEPAKPAAKGGAKKGKAAATKKKTARQTTTRSTRAKTTPAVSEAEDAPEPAAADTSVLRKSTRARAASNASTTSSVVPARPAAVAALSKSTRSRTAQAAAPAVEETSEVEVVAPKHAATSTTAASPAAAAVDSSDVEFVKPKRSTSSKSGRSKTVVESSAAEETEDADDSITQLARIADAALEAQGPEEAAAALPPPPAVPPKDSKKTKKASSSASANSLSSASSSSNSGGVKAKKGKKAAVQAASSAEEESAQSGQSGKSTPQAQPEPMLVEEAAKADSTQSSAAAPSTVTAPAPASISTLPQPPPALRSPLPPTSPGTSSSRPIRALPPNKSSKSPSSGSLKGLSLPPTMEAAPPVPSPVGRVAPSQSSSSQSSVPTSAFETASERLSSLTLDPSAPFNAPANPFAGSTLLSLVPPPTQQELDTLTVAEWFTLCHQRIAERFSAEDEAMRKHFDARLEAGRTKLRGMCDEAREREEREAREDEENRRAVAKERKERIAASGGGNRSAVKAGGGSTRKMR
ncbi:hypothetical protein JCM10908_005926 [Rhodotorula pacifica]|uniref:uncharacterized protein n=1 Tax=Rhodotorula pacifica TaxID=1495444 RepID=UPI00316BC6CB